MKNLLISSCLAGNNCKYSGGNNALPDDIYAELKKHYILIPVCPEVAGGLPVPRDPSERTGEKVISVNGKDVTENYLKGAETALVLADKHGCREALLKESSPSCGSRLIYDGTFSGVKIPGKGVTAEKLSERGIKVMSEHEINKLEEMSGPSLAEVLAACDHTLLRVDCTSDEIKTLCDQAIRFRCASVCIPPCHVAGAKRYAGNQLKICTVIGFPNGYATSAVKAFEASDAIRNGADEIDMVINLSMVKDGCWEDVRSDILEVRKATDGYILKVIIECCLLTEEEKIRLCEIVSECGADFIKTSTGFSKGGATFDDVALMRRYCPAAVRVKAAGGISTMDDAKKFMQLGAERLGTSRIVKLAIEQEKNEKI